MMSYFGLTHICLAGEKKYVAGNIAKPEDFSIEVGLLLWVRGYLHGSFQGHSTQLKKQTKTIVSNTQSPSTIGTMELLSWEQIN